MANLGYIRVSTVDQNDARQREALEQYGIDRWYEEKISAKDTNRPQLQAMLDYCREGDTIYVHDFSRLARSTKDLLDLVDSLQKQGVRLISHKENLDTHTSTGKLMLTMIAAIAEFERENLLERQREGIEIAKRDGKYKGRKKVVIDENLFNSLLADYQVRKITKSQMAASLGVSRPTLDRLIDTRR